VLIQACLNGARSRAEHAGVPVTAAAIADDALACVRAGAASVHVHPRDASARETLAAADVGRAVEAIRAACPGVQIGVTTAAWIVPDAELRLAAVRAWTALPDVASVNLGEEGALQMIELLNARGVGVEAGVWSLADARLLVDEGIDTACVRVLVEVESAQSPAEALQLAGAIDAILDDGLAETPRLHHGGDITAWTVIVAAMERGHDVRVGFEDTLVMPDGSIAASNATLVAAAAELARRAGRALDASARLAGRD